MNLASASLKKRGLSCVLVVASCYLLATPLLLLATYQANLPHLFTAYPLPRPGFNSTLRHRVQVLPGETEDGEEEVWRMKSETCSVLK